MIAAALLLPTAAATAKPKPKHRHGADLVISRLNVDTGGKPDYIVEATDGSLSSFSVDVTVHNAGDRAARPSHLKLWIYQAGPPSRLIAVEYAPIPRLAPKDDQPVTFDVPGLRPSVSRLTPIYVGVKANYNLVVPETHYTNNHRVSAHIPVIAREWKVTTWSVNATSILSTPSGILQVDSTNDTLPGFVWKFNGYNAANGIFTYVDHGGINQDTKLSSPPCSGAGSGTASGTTWGPPNSLFAIDYLAEHYGASLFLKGEKPYSVPYTCNPNGSGTANIDFIDFETYGPGPPPQSYPFGARSLSGSGAMSHGFATITYKWRFDADVP